MKIIVGLSEHVLEALRRHEKFFLSRGSASGNPGSTSSLLLATVSIQLARESLRRIEHEYLLKDELDPARTARPLTISQQHRQTTLVLEDRGEEILDHVLPGPGGPGQSWSCRSKLSELSVTVVRPRLTRVLPFGPPSRRANPNPLEVKPD
jgi:hypothetical protein